MTLRTTVLTLRVSLLIELAGILYLLPDGARQVVVIGAVIAAALVLLILGAAAWITELPPKLRK